MGYRNGPLTGKGPEWSKKEWDAAWSEYFDSLKELERSSYRRNALLSAQALQAAAEKKDISATLGNELDKELKHLDELKRHSLQAYRQLKGALYPESPLSSVLARLGAAMDLMLRALAADAPEASRSLERSISAAYAAYWHARSLHESPVHTETTAREALDEMARCLALLKDAAGPELLP